MPVRLDNDRWRALSPHLDHALDLDAEQRVAWLAALRTEDPALAADLETLLEQHDTLTEAGFLEGDSPAAPAAGSLAGHAIGAYTLRSLVGQGGMGSVWLADRNDGRFEGVAAVKLLNASLVGSEGEARFRREGNFLARLRHPHIAHLIDAGVSPFGPPYLVLEHVAGERIDHYCDARQLGIGARIRLFLDVLAAVAHAHANLIVHRDIKPSNVMVTGDGQVKLLDFGIAKMLEPDGAAEVTGLTRAGEAVLTPEYAAPEQLTGGQVTTVTDVYALGVLLYLLLTGQHPVGATDTSPAGLVKAIVDTETPRASAAVVATARLMPEALAEAAARRAATPRRLRNVLRGDLDNIVAKALKKAPPLRYATVEALAEDLRRCLRHEPVTARRDSVAYRAAKFVRRNRWFVVAAALTAVGLSAGLFVANRERAIAQRRFVLVRELAGKLFDIDAQVRQLPGSSKTRQSIVDMSLDYLRKLASDVRGDQELALEVGTAYMRVARVQGVPISANLGQMDQAEHNLEIAQGMLESVLAAQPANRTAILRMGQICHDRMILAGLRRPDDQALPLARESAAWFDKYLGSGPVDPAEANQVALALNNVGNRFRVSDEFGEALRLTRGGIEVARTARLERQVAGSLIASSRIHHDRGDLGPALQDIREAVRILEPDPGAAPSQTVAMTLVLALIEQGAVLASDGGVDLGQTEEAVSSLRRAFALADEFVHQDATEATSRSRLFAAGGPLAALLLRSDARQALEIYDHVLRHLAEIKDNPKFRRDEARALAASTYALRRLGRKVEAGRNLAGCFSRLSELRLHPSERVELGSEADDALRALADHEADTGDLGKAIETYGQLLDKIMAARPKVEGNLAEAASLSRLHASLAALHRRSGRPELASLQESRRLELWRSWSRRLPDNPFVLRQLEGSAAR